MCRRRRFLVGDVSFLLDLQSATMWLCGGGCFVHFFSVYVLYVGDAVVSWLVVVYIPFIGDAVRCGAVVT